MQDTVMIVISVIGLVASFASGCKYKDRNKEADVIGEMTTILGEKVDCQNVIVDEGFLCKSETGRNYYCPRDKDLKCFFTARLLLVDKPLEKVEKPPLTK